MEIFSRISEWLKVQHVVAYCVSDGVSLWCANAFYVFDPAAVAFYLLTSPASRHGRMAGKRALVAGTVSDQSQTVIHIRGLQFRGELRQLQSQEGEDARKRYYQRFPAARVMSAPVWAIDIDEMKFTDNRLGFGKKLSWRRDGDPSSSAN
ncbi:TPA: YhbP family protein [Raoultella planticola]